MGDELGAWSPLSVTEVATLFADAPFPWWVAGGWAIDLFAGRQTREHGDTDVLLLRRDQLLAQAVLSGWDLHAADPPGVLRPWRPGEALPVGVHDVWCRRRPAAAWALQLMLAECDRDGRRWRFRRDPRIGGPVSRLGRRSGDGIPYLAPEVQLLYKAKGRRSKDEQDLQTVSPLLAPAARRWLVAALTTWQPGHPWLAHLGEHAPASSLPRDPKNDPKKHG